MSPRSVDVHHVGERLRREWIEVSGRVQGVGFRASVVNLASRRPVAGWVRNEPGGTVLMLLEGVRSDLDAFVEVISLERAADISSIDRREVEATDREKGPYEPLTGFCIKFDRLPGR